MSDKQDERCIGVTSCQQCRDTGARGIKDCPIEKMSAWEADGYHATVGGESKKRTELHADCPLPRIITTSTPLSPRKKGGTSDER